MAIPIALSVLPGAALFTTFLLIPLGVLLVTSFSDWSVFAFRFNGLANYGGGSSTTRSSGQRSKTPLPIRGRRHLHPGADRGRGRDDPRGTHPRRWRTFRLILFAPVVVSGAAYALIFANVYNARYGLLNWVLHYLGIAGRDWLFNVGTALPAVAGTYAFNIGFFMILVMTEITAIPVDVLEAAEVDGAKRVRRQIYIILPLLRHVIGTCVLLSLLSSLAFFDIVYILTSGGPNNATLSLTVYAFQQYTADQWGYANAIGVFLVVTGFVVIVTMKRLFRIGEREL